MKEDFDSYRYKQRQHLQQLKDKQHDLKTRKKTEAQDILELIENRRSEILFYNGEHDIEAKFAIKVLDRLIEEIKEKL